MNNNIRAEIINGHYKDGNSWTGVVFYVMTEAGEYKSQISFPTALELELVKKAINPMAAIYGNQDNR